MNQPIRVLQLFTVLNRGGAETNIMNYYRKLDKSKFQFDFIVHREEVGAYESEILELGGNIFRFMPFNPLKINSYKKQISFFFDNNDYKIIHGNCSELGIYIYKEAKKRNVPVIIAHGHNATSGFNLKTPFRLFYKSRMLHYINAYFSCGHQAAVWLFGKENAKKAFIMNNAINSKDFVFSESLSAYYRKEFVAEKSLNLIHVGRFSEQKNHLFLIDIFYNLTLINSNVKLFLVGIGSLKSSIEKKINLLKIQDKVVFLGSRSDVDVVLQAMDIFILPSLFEGLPVSLVEAQAAGLKCFISNGVPTESILIPKNVSIINLKESAGSWANSINESRNFNKIDTAEIIVNAGFDINSNIKILEDKYLELLSVHS